jgi:hypothetical protein
MKKCHTGGHLMLRKYTLCLAGILALALGSVGCGDTHPRGGYFDVAWNIDSRTYGPTTCERAGLVMVTLATQNVRSGEVFYDDFNCVDRAGYSMALPVGDYSVALYAYTNPQSEDYLTSYAFPVSYPVYPDSPTTLPEVSLVVP